MKINHIFVSINARDFSAQSDWWAMLIRRSWDQEPMPSCHEWNLTDDVLFQVLDSDKGFDKTRVTLHVPNLDAEIDRLQKADIDVPEPVKVEGFKSLRYVEFTDPEGNTVGLLDGK